MKPKITIREEGWIEVTIDDNCESTKFLEAADLLKKQFKVRFINKLSHFDDAYWDFIYKDCKLTLHFNHYLGVSLFPKEFGESSNADNECAKEIGTLLFDASTEFINIEGLN